MTNGRERMGVITNNAGDKMIDDENSLSLSNNATRSRHLR
jgi:hypothetical protein